MTHHQNQPAHGTTLPIYHPKPAGHAPTSADSSFIPGRSSVAGVAGPHISKAAHPVQLAAQIGHAHPSADNGFIPGRSSVVGLPGPHVHKTAHPVQLAGQVGHLGVQLRAASHTGGSDSTRAHLQAQAIIAELQKELAQPGGRNILTPRAHTLQHQLDQALRTIALDDRVSRQ